MNPPTYNITSNQLLAALTAVQNGKRPLPDKGICDNVEDLFLHDFEQYHTLKYQGQTLYHWFQETAKEWGGFSGDPYYPVPSPRKAIDVQLAYQRYPCWEGEYGQSRLNLLDFFMGQVQDIMGGDYQEITQPKVITIEIIGDSKADMPEDCVDFGVTSDGRISFEVPAMETSKQVLQRLQNLLAYQRQKVSDFEQLAERRPTEKDKWLGKAQHQQALVVKYQGFLDRYIKGQSDGNTL